MRHLGASSAPQGRGRSRSFLPGTHIGVYPLQLTAGVATCKCQEKKLGGAFSTTLPAPTAQQSSSRSPKSLKSPLLHSLRFSHVYVFSPTYVFTGFCLAFFPFTSPNSQPGSTKALVSPSASSPLPLSALRLDFYLSPLEQPT